MTVQIGVGDAFTYKKDHWVITDVKKDTFECKNKDTGATVSFDKEIVRKLFK